MNWFNFSKLICFLLPVLSPFLFRPEVESLMLRVKEVISEHERLTSTAFAKDDVTGARKIVAKMQYFINLKDKLIIKETDLGIMH